METEEFTAVPYAYRAMVADSLTGVDMERLKEDFGGPDARCHCNLQQAYDNGNIISVNTNSSGLATMVTVINNSSIPNTTTTSNPNLYSYVKTAAGKAQAAYFYSEDNLINNQAGVLINNWTGGDGLFIFKTKSMTGTNPPFAGDALRIVNGNPHSTGIEVVSNGEGPAGSLVGFPAIRSTTTGGAEAGYFTISAGGNPNPTTASAIRGEIPTGSGIAVNASAGEFITGDGLNVATTLKVQTDGIGTANRTSPAQTVLINNPGNLNDALSVMTKGWGHSISADNLGVGSAAGYFHIQNSNNVPNASTHSFGLEVYNEGICRGLGVFNTNSSNHLEALEVTTAGSSGCAAVFGIGPNNSTNPSSVILASTAGLGRAGYFYQRNAANTANAIEVLNSGLGRTGLFWNNNTNSTADVVSINGRGNSRLLEVFNGAATASHWPTINPLVHIYNTANLGNYSPLFLESNVGSNQLMSLNYSALGGTNWFQNTSTSATNVVVAITQMGQGDALGVLSNFSGINIGTSNSTAPTAHALTVAAPLGAVAGAVKVSGDVNVYGNWTVTGGVKSAVVKDGSGNPKTLFCEESTEIWFTDYGIGQLSNGTATINFDAIFLSTVNTGLPYHVFVQLEGDCNGSGVKVINKTNSSFTVSKLADGNDCNASFSYRITAKRKGLETLRLATLEQIRNASVSNLQNEWPELVTEREQTLNQAFQPNNNMIANPPSIPDLQVDQANDDMPAASAPAPITPMTPRNYPPMTIPDVTPPVLH